MSASRSDQASISNSEILPLPRASFMLPRNSLHKPPRLLGEMRIEKVLPLPGDRLTLPGDRLPLPVDRGSLI